MDLREKLFALFQDCNNPAWKWFPNNAEMLKFVDYLIANGVTVQEWIPVSERLPGESGMYIVTALYGNAKRVSFVNWQKRNRTWNLTGARSYWRITNWMKMPEPPKGD